METSGMERIFHRITPDAYYDFQCIGGDCPSNCCSGSWTIFVDEATDRKYQALEGEFGEQVNRCIDRSETPARLRLNEDGRCDLLTEDGWCSVQQKLGAEYLCNVCRTYPRLSRTEHGVEFSYLTSSCPVVAKDELTRSEAVMLMRIDAKERGEEEDETAYAAFLASVRILQNRNCGIVQRQKLFLTFHQALRDAVGDPKATEELLRFFESPANYRALAAEPDKGCDLISKVRLLTRLCQPLLRDIHTLARGVFEEVLGMLSDSDVIERARPYLTQWNDKEEYARAQENILIDSCLAHYMDERCGDCLQQAGYIVVMDQLLRLFVAIGSEKAGALLPLDEQARYLAFLSRGFGHNGELKKLVSGLLAQEGMLELPFLFRLIS